MQKMYRKDTKGNAQLRLRLALLGCSVEMTTGQTTRFYDILEVQDGNHAHGPGVCVGLGNYDRAADCYPVYRRPIFLEKTIARMYETGEFIQQGGFKWRIIRPEGDK